MAAKCYLAYNGSATPVKYSHWGPCAMSDGNTAVSCCNNGDVCLSNGMCQFGAGMVGVERGASGIYMAGCTDSTYSAEVCNRNCSSYANYDVVFDWWNNVWRCCGLSSTGIRNCSLPQGAPMHGPNPADVKQIATIVAEGSFVPLATVTSAGVLPGSTSAPTVPPSLSVEGASSNSITPGTAAGIAVGATLAIQTIFAFGTWLIWYGRKKQQRATGSPACNETSGKESRRSPWHEVESRVSLKATPNHELGVVKAMRIHELQERAT